MKAFTPWTDLAVARGLVLVAGQGAGVFSLDRMNFGNRE